MKNFVSILAFCLSVVSAIAVQKSPQWVSVGGAYGGKSGGVVLPSGAVAILDSSSCGGDFKDFEFTQNGESLILKTTKKQAKKLKNKVKKALGQSFCFNGDFENFKDIVSNFKFEKIKEDLFDGIVCVYGFSKVFRENEYIVLDNTKYNIQIVFNKGVITIGFPIIVGSY